MTDNLWDAWKIITKGLLQYGNCPFIGENGGDECEVQFFSYQHEDQAVYGVEIVNPSEEFYD